MKFQRTELAAKQCEKGERLGRWHVIEAIAQDADALGVKITGIRSQVAAKEACETAGLDFSAGGISQLCLTAKFDWESTPEQRRIWRSYGWTSILLVAAAGWDQQDAADLLGGRHLSFREIVRLGRINRRTDRIGANTKTLPVRWEQWITTINKVMMDGARLLHETEEANVELTGHAQLAVLMYERLLEKKLDAELRQLLETDAR